jgi:ribosome-binding factor A
MSSRGNHRRPRGAGGGASGLDSKHRRKLEQLCRQVCRALMYAIPGEVGDPLLQGLCLEEVLPAPDASRLLVRLRHEGTAERMGEILKRLEVVEPYLRAQVAAAITRKRAPELTFTVAFGRGVTP